MLARACQKLDAVGRRPPLGCSPNLCCGMRVRTPCTPPREDAGHGHAVVAAPAHTPSLAHPFSSACMSRARTARRKIMASSCWPFGYYCAGIALLAACRACELCKRTNASLHRCMQRPRVLQHIGGVLRARHRYSLVVHLYSRATPRARPECLKPAIASIEADPLAAAELAAETSTGGPACVHLAPGGQIHSRSRAASGCARWRPTTAARPAALRAWRADVSARRRRRRPAEETVQRNNNSFGASRSGAFQACTRSPRGRRVR